MFFITKEIKEQNDRVGGRNLGRDTGVVSNSHHHSPSEQKPERLNKLDTK
jgi:hypothetical protein